MPKNYKKETVARKTNIRLGRWLLIWSASHPMMYTRCEGPRHKSRNGGTLGTISQLALDPLCKQEIDKLPSIRQHSIHSIVWQIDQCMFFFWFIHGITWYSRHLFSSSKTKLIKIVVSCKNTRKTKTNVLGKKCARFMVLLEKTRISQNMYQKQGWYKFLCTKGESRYLYN